MSDKIEPNLQPRYNVASVLHEFVQISYFLTFFKLAKQIKLQVPKFIRDGHI